MRNALFVLGAGKKEEEGEEGCVSLRSFTCDMRVVSSAGDASRLALPGWGQLAQLAE